MTALLAAGVLSSFWLDWSANHLLHPAWPPHARFHGALLLFFLAGVSAAGIWLMWSAPSGVRAGVRTSALLALSFWTPLFYIPYLFPSATWWAGAPGSEPRYGGWAIYPNLIVAGVFIAAALAAFRLCRADT